MTPTTASPPPAAAGPDWALFAILTAELTAVVEVLGVIAVYVVPHVQQMAHDFKVDQSLLTSATFAVATFVWGGGWLLLAPLLPLLSLLTVVALPPTGDPAAVARRRRAAVLAFLLVAVGLLVIQAVGVLLAYIPVMAAAGPQKR